ncbi:MAG: GTP 3',8-cyclase MoaA [Planctomycetes bacterium]|nr:GTP 3',8-cyclase MoaA [Planctomycetota bacterium]
MNQTVNSAVSLRLSVTDRCQLGCTYCVHGHEPEKLPQDRVLRFEQMMTLVRTLKECFEVEKVHVTGGEPLLRRGTENLIQMLRQESIGDIAMTTNGQLLAPVVGRLRDSGLRRINVSLDTLDGEKFARLTGGRLDATLDGIRSAIRAGMSPIKINMVVLRGVNDGEISPMARFGLENGLQVRFIEIMPIGPAAEWHRDLFMPSAEIRRELAGHFTLTDAGRAGGESAGVADIRDAAGRSGQVGFIASISEPFCGQCRRLRLTCDGRLIGCLACHDGIAIGELLRKDTAENRRFIMDAVRDALGCKSASRPFTQARPMDKIGG